jgi:hypothetical protein
MSVVGNSLGQFEGVVVARWDADGRMMTLVENFTYIDPVAKRWSAPAGSVVNGASIPRAFWTLIGGPFEGEYRNASVVHDVACEQMLENWADVHCMFYQACLCGGVASTKAKLMYWAVYRFGPRWEAAEQQTDAHGRELTADPARMQSMPEPSPELVEEAEKFFAEHEPSADEIPGLYLPSETDPQPMP